ncbi:MAG TPA: hypothetical protein VGY49_13870 [Burkholderiaceae bacterium]|jgi:hypothetical protein|nr:hypothetical protein [Burkholderiaceae bacterium]
MHQRATHSALCQLDAGRQSRKRFIDVAVHAVARKNAFLDPDAPFHRRQRGPVGQVAAFEVGQRAGFINGCQFDSEKVLQDAASGGVPRRLLLYGFARGGSLMHVRVLRLTCGLGIRFLRLRRVRQSTKMQRCTAGFVGLKANPDTDWIKALAG